MVDEGETRTLQILFGAQAVDATLYLGIYTNAAQPGETANLAAITEPSGNGYARIALSRGSWVISGDLASYAQQTFTCNGDGAWGNCNGYFIATSVDGTGRLLFVEDFTNKPYLPSLVGDAIRVTPNVRAA